MANRLHGLILTAGEPAGIGPDLCLAIALEEWNAAITVAADPDLLAQRNKQLGLNVRILEHAADSRPVRHEAGALRVVPFPLVEPAVCGILNSTNAGYVLATLDHGIDACVSGLYDGMVTAPVQKSALLDAGYDFTGHTEYIAKRTGHATPVMMLVSDDLRVALVTTHLPLHEVAAAVTADRLRAVIEVVNCDLRRLFGINEPRIRVLGLNPHAGEDGYLGQEEQRIITPVLELLRERGLQLEGPVSADTAFRPDTLPGTDVILAMYHDQGLPVLKFAGFGDSANVTLGLSLVRTSVDHGTALSLAGTGNADAGSLRQAIRLALELAANANKQ